MPRFSPACPPSVGRMLSGFSFNDKLFYYFYCQRLDIYSVSNIFICHDGCRVGVQKNNFQTFFFQGTAGLCTCIVKFCCLSDDNRTGANYNTFLISLILGIINSSSHHIHKSVKQVSGILWSRACFRMELYCENILSFGMKFLRWFRH